MGQPGPELAHRLKVETDTHTENHNTVCCLLGGVLGMLRERGGEQSSGQHGGELSPEG